MHFHEKPGRNLARDSRNPFSFDVFITPNATLRARDPSLSADKLLLKRQTLSRHILAISGRKIQQTQALKHLRNGTARGRGKCGGGREPSHC